MKVLSFFFSFFLLFFLFLFIFFSSSPFFISNVFVLFVQKKGEEKKKIKRKRKKRRKKEKKKKKIKTPQSLTNFLSFKKPARTVAGVPTCFKNNLHWQWCKECLQPFLYSRFLLHIGIISPMPHTDVQSLHSLAQRIHRI